MIWLVNCLMLFKFFSEIFVFMEMMVAFFIFCLMFLLRILEKLIFVVFVWLFMSFVVLVYCMLFVMIFVSSGKCYSYYSRTRMEYVFNFLSSLLSKLMVWIIMVLILFGENLSLYCDKEWDKFKVIGVRSVFVNFSINSLSW